MGDFFAYEKYGTRDIVYNRSLFHEKGYEVGGFIESQCLSRISEYLPKDAVVACGGDGTLIEAFHRFGERPILGINYGTRGFLMCDRESVMKSQKFSTQKRNTLSLKIFDNEYCALNEFSIKSTSGHILIADIEIGSNMIVLKADGCVISTMSGSTAYSNSLGGPILLSDDVFSFTPIAPLSPRAMNPLVLGKDSSLEITFSPDRPTDFVIYADGREIYSGNSHNLPSLQIGIGKKNLHLLLPEGGTGNNPLTIFSYN